MINITDPKNCCGCTACESICGKNAITMKPDALGFLYPVVDLEKCVECGMCEKVCAFHENYDVTLNLPQAEAYAAAEVCLSQPLIMCWSWAAWYTVSGTRSISVWPINVP